MSHIEKAQELGEKSFVEKWNATKTMTEINKLMEEFGHGLSGEIQAAFAQGLMGMAKKEKNENEKV